MRTNKLLVLSCLFFLFAIPASLSIFAFFYHTDYEHRSAIYYANEATNRIGLTPSPTIFHFQSNVISAKQRETLTNTPIPTETAERTDGENIILTKNETTVLAAKIEESAPAPTQPAPTVAETKVKDVAPTPTLFVPQPSPTPIKLTPTPQPKAVASEPVRSSSAVVVETPASSLVIEPNVPATQPTNSTQPVTQPKVCGEGEFC